MKSSASTVKEGRSANSVIAQQRIKRGKTSKRAKNEFAPNEAQTQQSILEWCEWNRHKWPELALIYHIPNGGLRTVSEGAKFKRLGVKPGMPDLCLPVARCGFYALYIEIKRKGGKLSAEQKRMIAALEGAGNCVKVMDNFRQTVDLILTYLASSITIGTSTDIAELMKGMKE